MCRGCEFVDKYWEGVSLGREPGDFGEGGGSPSNVHAYHDVKKGGSTRSYSSICWRTDLTNT